MILKRSILTALLAVVTLTASAASPREQAKQKMDELSTLIKKANKKKVNTLKERTALRTAEIFMGYADWDEANLEKNIKHFSLVTRYKKEPEKWAKLLPDFERNDIVKMMDSSIAELQGVMDGKITRRPTPDVDWKETTLKGDAIYYKNKPVFLADWTWKPRVKEYCEYHGDQDGFFLTPPYVINEKGDVSPNIIRQLKEKEDGSMGFIFFNHSNFPAWAKKKDPSVVKGPGIKYTMYDINNPLAREVQSNLIKNVVPLMAGKQYTKLGYMLCNEPHWNTIEKSWASAPFSDLAYEEFKKWLEAKHKTVKELNKVWGKNYKSFNDIDCPKIMRNELQGTPMYFDYMAFNMDRVTDWFSFLASEIKKYDPEAKTHIKVMPNLWSEAKRDSGIDMEALTHNSDIIGNDASSCGKWMWGPAKHWEKYYSFDWIELIMAHDFFKSVAPNKIMYNTEGHFLTTGKTRDLYQPTEYARLNYWMATVHGLTASQTWYWCRREDGDSRQNEDSNGYAGSNNHQPRIVNEVHATIADLNSVSDIIMDFQRQEKPIRLFYSKASSINSLEYMEEVFTSFERLVFEGMPIGFATEGIIKNQDNDSWKSIVVASTPKLFNDDVAALQSYLNGGGTVIVDSHSMKSDEYGRPLKMTLTAGKGKLVKVATPADAAAKALELAKGYKSYPTIALSENNGLPQKGTIWRTIKGEKGATILNVGNVSKNATTLNLKYNNGKEIKSVTNMLTGQKLSSTITLPVYGQLLLEVK